MKRTYLAYFLPLTALLYVGVISIAFAREPEVSEKDGREILESLKDVGTMNRDIQNVGKQLVNCPGCAAKEPDLKVYLEGDTVDLGNPYYIHENEPYVIYLKRTAKTPAKIDLKFKNGHDYCEKMYVGTNPWSPSGPLVMGCQLTLTRYEDEEVTLNLKNLRKLKGDETEVIEVKLTKRNPRAAKYEITVKNLSSVTAKEDIGKKFLGGGFNVSFEDVAP
ncbi:MAG: hypothetical protein H7177_13620 [Rhizobacter sp.]|nr:hypothetical protein [Bacteriovorax sp.]